MDADPHLERWQAATLALGLFAKAGEGSMDRQRRAHRPLRGIFQSHRGTKEGQDAVAGQLVDRTLELVDLVDQDLVETLHQGVGLFGTDLLHQSRVTRQIAEQDGHLPALALETLPLSQGSLSELRRYVAVDERGIRGWSRGRRGQFFAAPTTELKTRRAGEITTRTSLFELRPTGTAKAHPCGVLEAAFWADQRRLSSATRA